MMLGSHPSEPVLVRVSPEILEKLATEGSEPVVIIGVEKQSDATYDMTLRTPPRSVPVEDVVKWLRRDYSPAGVAFADAFAEQFGGSRAS